MEILTADRNDLDTMLDMFWSHISSHPEYISHGEVQMGVAEIRIRDGKEERVPSPTGRENWKRYIEGKAESADARIIKAESEGVMEGFCVAEITDDGAERFGIICDIMVRESSRRKGIGESLLAEAVEWLKYRGIQDIYLESGKENRRAHEFFMKRGFRHISDIFKLF